MFFAISCPEEVKTQVAALQKELDSLRLPVVWEELDKLHLTLNFLGNKVDSSQLTDIRRAAFNVAAQTPKFELCLGFLETLYLRHDETLIYLAPKKEPLLLDLQNRMCIELNKLELDQPRKFLAHMVVGKLKRTDPVTTKNCINKISDYDYKPVPGFIVEDIKLYESFVSAKGSHYTKIGEFVLKC